MPMLNRAVACAVGRKSFALCSFLLAIITITTSASFARAESAVLRPLAEHPAPSAPELLAQLTAAEALVAANISIIDAADARERLRQAAEKPCLDVNCASSVLRVLNADMLVAVTLASDGEVLVALVDTNGHHVNANAPSTAGDVAAATRAAMNRALSKWPTRGLVPIAVDGTPAGATVTVDGQPRGMLPLEVRVQPGRHEVVVAMTGYTPARELVDVASSAASAPRVSVALESDGTDADARASQPSRLYLFAGPALALAGAATMTVALASFARTGCQQHAPDGVCVRQDHAIATAPLAVWTTVGAAALVGGATWFAIGRRRANQARRAQAQVDVGWNGISLRGSF
ncbi:MAG: hypothetical protein JWN04_571 [Myxococcaceae bacterium]|nr:hypothetical protein [Myxococcaceae bacterium]